MTIDTEWAEWLKSLPRERTPEESARYERERDTERGPYVPHGGIVHHVQQESRH